ncbi:MAG: hypothetical protein DRP42_05135 [Tenericutes bacterium]|nr:MAG: hypothetical protein DRP42_05135 [Mycoplasmatota bacterium]
MTKQKAVQDLIRGKKTAPTIGSYQTKGFSHDGVSGSEGLDRVDESRGGITPLPSDFKKPINRIVKDTVKGQARGDGMPPGKKTFRK